MTDDELRSELLSSTSLALDTSAFYLHELLRLADLVNRWNDHCSTSVDLVFSALVNTERQAQERRRRGSEFDIGRINRFLESKNIAVVPFSALDSERGSEWLASVARTSDRWKKLKWSRIAKECGLDPEAPRRVSATVDWFIAAHAQARGWVLVTNDKGPEFGAIPRSVQGSQLNRVLASVP